MKFKQSLAPLIALILLCQCSAKMKTIKIIYSEMYCGGAAPTEEMIKEMETKKPFGNRDIEVFTNLNLKDKPIIYKTNLNGEISIPIKLSNSIAISVYPTADLFRTDMAEDTNYLNCYTNFIRDNLISVNMNDKAKSLSFTVYIMCDPCLPPHP